MCSSVNSESPTLAAKTSLASFFFLFFFLTTTACRHGGLNPSIRMKALSPSPNCLFIPTRKTSQHYGRSPRADVLPWWTICGLQLSKRHVEISGPRIAYCWLSRFHCRHCYPNQCEYQTDKLIHDNWVKTRQYSNEVPAIPYLVEICRSNIQKVLQPSLQSCPPALGLSRLIDPQHAPLDPAFFRLNQL